ncbi:MAG: DUF1223 domain-containing protein [Terriglobia bacterium]|nr:DUF1223 domain-containing protein [Terriglobia bacterium]
MRVAISVLVPLSMLLLSVAGFSQQKRPTPVVVELFTSEGCSSCPPADHLLEQFRRAKQEEFQLILLGEHVDYWDGLGWKDRFSSRVFTDRQSAYSHRFKLGSAYTPQMVVDGRLEIVGNDAPAISKAIHTESTRAKPIELQLVWSTPTLLDVTIRGVTRAESTLMLAITEDNVTTNVRAGENGGRILRHTAVVRKLEKLGTISAGSYHSAVPTELDASWKKNNIMVVVWVEDRSGITGAASIDTAH